MEKHSDFAVGQHTNSMEKARIGGFKFNLSKRGQWPVFSWLVLFPWTPLY